jgi:hypothetical protein
MLGTKSALNFFHEIELHVDSRPDVQHVDNSLVDLTLRIPEALARLHQNISVPERRCVSRAHTQ